jgi:hypothetical protein
MAPDGSMKTDGGLAVMEVLFSGVDEEGERHGDNHSTMACRTTIFRTRRGHVECLLRAGAELDYCQDGSFYWDLRTARDKYGSEWMIEYQCAE